MENRFLFRGKRIDNGEWIVGSLIVDKHQHIETGEQIEIIGIYPYNFNLFSRLNMLMFINNQTPNNPFAVINPLSTE